METHNIKKGDLLVAELALTGDLSFSRSLVYMVEHNDEGSVGFILNKLTDFKLADLLPEISGDYKVYKGGPVDQDNLYYVHKIPDLLPGCIHIKEDIYWGGDFNLLMEGLINESIPADKIKFFLGYSGWAPEQLNDEIESESWIIYKNHLNIFDIKDASMWREKLIELGGDYLIWANSPENPSYN